MLLLTPEPGTTFYTVLYREGRRLPTTHPSDVPVSFHRASVGVRLEHAPRAGIPETLDDPSRPGTMLELHGVYIPMSGRAIAAVYGRVTVGLIPDDAVFLDPRDGSRWVRESDL